MERISMLKIEEEIEALRQEIEGLYEAKLVIFDKMYILTFIKEKPIEKDLEKIKIYKSTYKPRENKVYLQSKIYNSVVYNLGYNGATDTCNLIVEIKPGKPVIFVNDEEYVLSICGIGSSNLNIMWEKRNNTNEPVIEIRWELFLNSDLPMGTGIINTLNLPSSIQSLIEEILIIG